ncbi:hypothetical protein KGQ20_12785 [Catenulispora sp. NF23]|uniref:Uncharacterized protein n=1 Tax=Catenulispora pinistramenti TaxID=2705254 RepID=A0ABS5KHW3_9ACTN|nr:hypothetical protein [Catenulispora pinistramenti]MBS2533647.1 hypothetical protein [Catenulispora pinistramenti]MBS2545843.1 hypothetical protein [Catenulispora pinistramenti]
MEIVTAQMLAGALSKALDAAGGEAGRRSLAGLAWIVGKWKTRSGGEAGEALPALDSPLQPEQVPGLAQALAAAAAADPTLAAELADWHRAAVVTVTGAGDVTGTVSGTVDGSVVQARDIAGPVTFN